MDNPDETTGGFEISDHEFEKAIDGAQNAIAPVIEADTIFYARVINACDTEIGTITKEIADINAKAERLLESRKKLVSDRQRLAMQRNAARIAMRALEDSETRRHASQS